jgi:hypothetical protein
MSNPLVWLNTVEYMGRIQIRTHGTFEYGVASKSMSVCIPREEMRGFNTISGNSCTLSQTPY